MDFKESIQQKKAEQEAFISQEAQHERMAQIAQGQMELFWDPRSGLEIDKFSHLTDESKTALKGFARSLNAANIPYATISEVPKSFVPPSFALREALIKARTKHYEINRTTRMDRLQRERSQAKDNARQIISLGGWVIDRNSGSTFDDIPPSKMIVTPDLKIKTPDASDQNISDNDDIFGLSSRNSFVPHELKTGLKASNYQLFLRDNFDNDHIVRSVVENIAQLNIEWVEPGQESTF